MTSIPLPQPTIDRLTELLRQKATIDAVIDTTVQTAREALNVPADYVIGDVRVGFVAPGQKDTPPE